MADAEPPRKEYARAIVLPLGHIPGEYSKTLYGFGGKQPAVGSTIQMSCVVVSTPGLRLAENVPKQELGGVKVVVSGGHEVVVIFVECRMPNRWNFCRSL